MPTRVSGRHSRGRSVGLATAALAAVATTWLGSQAIEAADAHQSETPRPASAVSTASQRALLDRYCVACHNARQLAAGATPIALDALSVDEVGPGAESWEKVVFKLRAGVMPPAGAPRPDEAVADAFASWLEAELDRAAARNPNPGRTQPVHRLNRAEYQNSVRDLLAVDVDVTSLLPSDDVSVGFDNIASALGVSPTLLDRYLAAAQKVSRLAMGTRSPLPTVDYVRLADDLRQDDRLPGMPLGTRGGARIRHVFPRDGEYVIRVRLARDMYERMPRYDQPHELEVSLDGERLRVFTLPAAPPRGQRVQVIRDDGDWDVRVPVRAGEREIGVAFIQKTSALDETVRLPFLRPYPAGNNFPETRMGAAVRSVEISGPYGDSLAGESTSRQRILVCRPGAGVTLEEEAACASEILRALTRRAYRRPVTEEDLAPIVALYEDGRAEGGFEAGIERALKRLLVSPEFLYRVELDPADVPPGTPYRIGDLELASRLSFFLWSSIPDEELLDLAERGALRDPEVLAGQVRRMLDDPRSDALVENFAGQWLFLRNVPLTGPTPTAFPDFDESLRQAFRRETELFFESVLREDRSALDLLRADYTFLNERLAVHYGIRTVKGSHFRRYTWNANSPRAGLLGHGSILTVTSYPDRTSPVVRGKWILENLMGTPPPPPLPDVGDLQPTDGTGAVLSVRERLARHRADPACASCHSMIDPLGLALENFDAAGGWRTRGESGRPIDASAVLPDGTAVDGPVGLRDALLARSDRFVTTLTEKLLTYALGRRLEYYDAPAVRAILRDAADDEYRLSSLIRGIVESMPFRMRTTAGTAGASNE